MFLSKTRRFTLGYVVGLMATAFPTLHCKAEDVNGKDAPSPRRQTDTGKVSRRVIMLPVSVAGTPTTREEDAMPQFRLFVADKTAVPIIPSAIEIIYAPSQDRARSTDEKENILDMTVPVTILGAPGPGQTGYIREIQVFFTGDDARPRIPTEVRIVYALGVKPSLANLGVESLAAAASCSWIKINGVDKCVGTCPVGECVMITIVRDDGVPVSRCACVTIHPE